MNWTDLIESGAVGQAILGTLLGIGVLWQVTHNQPIDPTLGTFFGVVIGFFFRTVTTIVKANGSQSNYR